MEMIFVIVSSMVIGGRVKGKLLHVFAVIYPASLYLFFQSSTKMSSWNSFVLSGASILLIYSIALFIKKTTNK